MSFPLDLLRKITGGWAGLLSGRGCWWSGVESTPSRVGKMRGGGQSFHAGIQNCVQELGVEAQSVGNQDRSRCKCGYWSLQAAILKIKGTKAMHSRRNQAAKHSYERILGCHTSSEVSSSLLARQALHVLLIQLTMLLVVLTRSVLGQGYFQCNPNKMLQSNGSFLLPRGCLGPLRMVSLVSGL